MSRCVGPDNEDDISESFQRHTSSKRDLILKQISLSSTKKRKRRYKVFLEDCKFRLVQDVLINSGAVNVNYDDDWILAWIDGSVTKDHFNKMKPFQRINHFPGMSEICKKDLLCHNLKRMKKVLPEHYNFSPVTFCLPDEKLDLRKYCYRRKPEFFIIKPDSNCQGIGIDLVKGIPDTKKYHNVVCQKYISKPLLMERFKFDLRLYVLITSVLPLKIYIYKKGLVRLATIPYKKPSASNLNKKKMHLTNYAINKDSRDENSEDKDSHCKKSLCDFHNLLTSTGISSIEIWRIIDDIIVKTVFSALPTLQHLFQTAFPITTPVPSCFELLGFDVLLDSRGKPFLLEVNRSPSLGASSPFDKELKQSMIRNVLNMVLLTTKQINIIKREQHFKSLHRLTNSNATRSLTPKERIMAEFQEQKEIRMMENFRMLYPVEDDRYDEIRRMAFSLDGKNADNSKTNSTAKDD